VADKTILVEKSESACATCNMDQHLTTLIMINNNFPENGER